MLKPTRWKLVSTQIQLGACLIRDAK